MFLSFVAASFDLGILERGIFICSTLVSSSLFRVWSFHVFRLMDFRTRYIHMYHVFSSIHLNVYIHMYQAYFVYTFKSVFLFCGCQFRLRNFRTRYIHM